MRHDAIKVEAGNRVAKEASRRAAGHKESVVAFGERHGWKVTDEGSSDYFNDLSLTKGVKRVRLALWPGINKSIALASTHTGTVAVKVTDPMRERVERFLVGMECICEPEPEWLEGSSAYEGRPVSTCPVHGELPND